MRRGSAHFCIVGVLGSMRKLYCGEIMLFTGSDWIGSAGFEHGISRMGVCLEWLQDQLRILVDRLSLPA
jgi:hypothetical protein